MIFYTHISWLVPECSAKFGPNYSIFHETAAILIRKNHIFALFSHSILVIPMKLGRDIARGKGHLVCEFDLKRPRPSEMAATFRVWNHIFALFRNLFWLFQRNLVGKLLGVRGTERIWDDFEIKWLTARPRPIWWCHTTPCPPTPATLPSPACRPYLPPQAL